MFVFWVVLVLLLSSTAQAEPTTLTGTVTKVRDGDTIEVGRIPIRLNGVSAPEMREPLGPQSKTFMTDFVIGNVQALRYGPPAIAATITVMVRSKIPVCPRRHPRPRHFQASNSSNVHAYPLREHG
jgi:hypothetical protein